MHIAGRAVALEATSHPKVEIEFKVQTIKVALELLDQNCHAQNVNSLNLGSWKFQELYSKVRRLKTGSVLHASSLIATCTVLPTVTVFFLWQLI